MSIEKKLVKDNTTSTRLSNDVLALVKEHVAGKTIAPAKFFEACAIQVMNGAGPEWEFKEGDKIKNKKGQYVCVCASLTIAIFAPFVGKKTKYTGMIALSNFKMFSDAHDFKRIS